MTRARILGRQMTPPKSSRPRTPLVNDAEPSCLQLGTMSRFGMRPPCRYAEDRQGLLAARGRSPTVGAVCDRPYFVDYKKNARSQTAPTVDTTNSADFCRGLLGGSPVDRAALQTKFTP